jgi:hypothetical protein
MSADMWARPVKWSKTPFTSSPLLTDGAHLSDPSPTSAAPLLVSERESSASQGELPCTRARGGRG